MKEIHSGRKYQVTQWAKLSTWNGKIKVLAWSVTLCALVWKKQHPHNFGICVYPFASKLLFWGLWDVSRTSQAQPLLRQSPLQPLSLVVCIYHHRCPTFQHKQTEIPRSSRLTFLWLHRVLPYISFKAWSRLFSFSSWCPVPLRTSASNVPLKL